MNEGRSLFFPTVGTRPTPPLPRASDAITATAVCEPSAAGTNSSPWPLPNSPTVSQVTQGTFADANEKRDWRIYADFAQVLMSEARRLYAGEELDEPSVAMARDFIGGEMQRGPRLLREAPTRPAAPSGSSPSSMVAIS